MNETIRVKVTVDTDELREWAGKHADAGHHGVAHVLYKAAEEGESLTEQALREARAEGAAIGYRAALDPGSFVKRGASELAGEPFTERMDQWQRRAIDEGLARANSGWAS
jgi:hypothetical protein